MGFIALSASVEKRQDNSLFCSQKSFDNAIEIVVEMLDRLDRCDRLFAEDE